MPGTGLEPVRGCPQGVKLSEVLASNPTGGLRGRMHIRRKEPGRRSRPQSLVVTQLSRYTETRVDTTTTAQSSVRVAM